MKTNYGHDFYKDRHQKTVYAARVILSLVLDSLPPVHSAIDFGCGIGTWLSVLKEKGITEIRGIDGPWVEQNLLEIPREDFHQVELEKTIKLEKKYDLAISLEVAEHLPKESAASFVDSLVSASDFILFSAAIPYQGGCGHVNEQWSDYWVNLFANRGYVVLDFVRKRIWNDRKIPVWYRQNIFIFAKDDKYQDIIIPLDGSENHVPFSLVHPDLYLLKIAKMASEIAWMSSVRGSWTLFWRAVKTCIWKKTY